MDPSYGAYGRIALFLADLNLVLGCLPTPTSSRPVAFNSFVSPQNPNRSSLDFHSQLSRKQPTHRSRAWKKTHSRFGREQIRKAGNTSKSYPVDFPAIQPSVHVYSRHKHQGPQESSQRFSQSLPTNQHQPSKSAREHDVQYVSYPYNQDPHLAEDSQGETYASEYLNQEEPSAVDYPNDSAEDHSSLQFQPPCVRMSEDQQSSDKSIGDAHEIDEIQVDEIERDDRSDLDISAAPNYQQDTDQTFPEDFNNHFLPRTDSIQQPKPTFDLKNYSAEDVDNWASTLSADEFEHLRVMGPDARTESFRQYATLHIDQLTQPNSPLNSLSPQSNQALHNQNIYPTPNEIDNHCIPSRHVEHHPDQFNPSNYYDHSNYCTSDLDQNPENKSVLDESGFNGGFDDGGFDDGGFDDGGFDGGGFDDGGFDDGGFDDGGFDDGGFDDGGFDDNGFDDDGFDDCGFEDGGFDGGFDDDYGSPHY
ncbi:hypothetical protein PGT21_018854 [Puccinia graminis f. sp. tritici]|uniref:Uncharacterized protein n=1 Tax=Puccinia graminis f. sp. tritici TaxID=56615 RepID=A0A5B0RZW5_PUCGR|nr:hypothetical protein PGT21_018854 [Puccinia graminis f. sp. tritici]KAA1130333.1 hypothetical protein PGTUg99_017311 [Puccinia graminis f. sp. tritici]